MNEPSPPPADREFLAKAKAVIMTHSFDSWTIENWVNKVAETSGQKLDWSFIGGRAVIRAMGDMDKIYEAIEKHKVELQQTWSSMEVERNRIQNVVNGDGPDGPYFHCYDFPWLLYPKESE